MKLYLIPGLMRVFRPVVIIKYANKPSKKNKLIKVTISKMEKKNLFTI